MNMDNSFKASILYANCLEFHYQFDDGSHSMDALVFNKCEGEVLAMLRELSQKIKYNIVILDFKHSVFENLYKQFNIKIRREK